LKSTADLDKKKQELI